MEVTPQPPVQTPPVIPTAPGIFGTKIPSTTAFAVGILLFFMPFIDIKCNDMSLQKISGVELATGFHIKGPGSNSLMDSFDKTTSEENKKPENREPYMLAVAALALGVAGLLLSLMNNKAGSAGGLVTGILSAVAMIGMMVDVKSDLKKESLGGDGQDVKISVDFTAWFFISLLAFLAAAYFSNRRRKAMTNLRP